MTYFPNATLPRPEAAAAAAFANARPAIRRDILWNQPVFKAPVLANPRIALDPLPFTTSRLTRRAPHR
jgi:hypothetical protein